MRTNLTKSNFFKVVFPVIIIIYFLSLVFMHHFYVSDRNHSTGLLLCLYVFFTYPYMTVISIWAIVYYKRHYEIKKGIFILDIVVLILTFVLVIFTYIIFRGPDPEWYLKLFNF